MARPLAISSPRYHRVLFDTVRHTTSSPSAHRPHAAHDAGALDATTLAALRDLLAPPAESEAETARFVAAIMARLPRARRASVPRRMPSSRVRMALVALIAPLALLTACGRGAARGGSETSAAPAPGASATSAAVSPARPAEITAADVDVYERGLAQEIVLVRAAQERARVATTPQARAEATQAGWEDQTMPAAARAIGVAPDRYRRVRETLHTVMETLDFQGTIDGPMQLDTTRATPEMRARLARDPIAELAPAAAAAFRARLGRLTPLFVQYVTLTEVGG